MRHEIDFEPVKPVRDPTFLHRVADRVRNAKRFEMYDSSCCAVYYAIKVLGGKQPVFDVTQFDRLAERSGVAAGTWKIIYNCGHSHVQGRTSFLTWLEKTAARLDKKDLKSRVKIAA